MTEFRHVADHPVHEGHVWNVVVADFEAPDGSGFRRDVVRSPGAVSVVPLVFDAEGQPSVVLVSQYRGAYDAMLVEIPAGMRDVDGEPPEQTGRRELSEEAGLVASEIAHLVDIYPSPGMSDSVTTIYLATGCRPVERDLHGPEEEHMELLHVPFDEALAMIDRGEIRDAKTVIGLLLTERRMRAGGPST